jgi:hypothetical protein
MVHLNYKHNEYADALGEPLYDAVPKAVFAAIAVSLVTCGGSYLEHADRILLEWAALYENGIVPQRPPKVLVERARLGATP